MLDAGDIDRVADRPGDRRRRRPRRRPSARTRSRSRRRSRRSRAPGRRSGCGGCRRSRTARCATRRPAASAMASTSSMVAAEAWATSTSIPRASIRRIISRPASVSPVLRDAVRRPAERVVEEVAGRHHPEAGVGHDLDVGRVAVQGMGALDGQEAGGDRGTVAPGDLVGGQVGRRSDDPEAAVGARGQAVGAAARWSARGRSRRHVAGGQPSARASRMTSSLRSSLRSRLRWRGDCVVAARTCERDVAVDQPRHVHLAAGPALQQVPAPEQRVGVEVGDPQAGVQRARPVGRLIGRPDAGHAQAGLRAADRGPAADLGRLRRDDAAPATPAATRLRRSTVTAGRRPPGAPAGPRRGRPASARRARARRGRTRAGPPRSRARPRARGAASRSPRCRAAGRP